MAIAFVLVSIRAIRRPLILVYIITVIMKKNSIEVGGMRKYKSSNYKSGSSVEEFDFALKALRNRFQAEGKNWITIGKSNSRNSLAMQRKSGENEKEDYEYR